jgi:hypothetical protein
LPVVNVRLTSSQASYDTIALVDSGATATFLMKEHAEILGLTFDKDKNGNEVKSETQGAGSTFICKRAIIHQIAVMKNVLPFCILRDVKVRVPESYDIFPYVILGRDYIFQRFDVTFHEGRHKLTFTKV